MDLMNPGYYFCPFAENNQSILNSFNAESAVFALKFSFQECVFHESEKAHGSQHKIRPFDYAKNRILHRINGSCVTQTCFR